MIKKALSILALLALTVPVYASGPQRLPFNDACTGLNCDARLVTGSQIALGTGDFGFPWVGEFFAEHGRCLRFDVILQRVADLEMIVIAPNGEIFQNDDQGFPNTGCFFCPLVKIPNSPNSGWYTVRIGRSRRIPGDAHFALLAAQYPRGNENCNEPTPLANAAIQEEKAEKDKK
jgi:hypothetical protein